MSIIRQGSLFDIQDFFDMEPSKRFEAIFSAIPIEPIVYAVSKKSIYGAPTELNYTAMIYALVARIHEGIPTVKLLVKRLKNDLLFRLDCGFLFSDQTPSEASFSRLIGKLNETQILEKERNSVVLQAIDEGFIQDDTAAIDASHFEARDRSVAQDKKPKAEPKKRGRKSKAEKEQWEKEKQVQDSQKNIYEKTVADQLDVPLEELRTQAPINPAWGIKKNSEGKNQFWFGYKAHFAVGTKSQYILQSLMTSGNLNDGKAAIPLLKGLKELPLKIKYLTLDAGYDYLPIYQQIHRIGAHAIIAYNKRNEGEMVGFDEHFAPTCVREHSYRYDSYDEKYKTLKYVQPKECRDCPLKGDSLCQKVYNIRIETDLRKYTAPARGSEKWKEIYKQRTAVERVNAYLKEYFQLNNVRYRTGKRAKVHFDLMTLIYNSTKLAVDRIKQELKQKTLIAA